MEEIEAKYLDIDPEGIQKKLLATGAVKKSEVLIRQKVYDYPDWRLDKMGAWIRLRDTGSKVTLAYKQRLGMKDGVANDSGMEEIEVAVGEFEKTAMIMEKAGFGIKFYEFLKLYAGFFLIFGPKFNRAIKFRVDNTSLNFG